MEANRKAWRARGDELGPGVGLGMYAGRAHGRRGYGDQRRTRGRGRAYLGDGGDEAGCSLHFCMRRCFSGGEASTGTFRSSHSTFNALATEPNPARTIIHGLRRQSPPRHATFPPPATISCYIIRNPCSPHASVIISLHVGFKEQIRATLSCSL